MQKLAAMLDLCSAIGVHTSPRMITSDASDPRSGVWVVPVLSWHHASFDTEPDIPGVAWLAACEGWG